MNDTRSSVVVELEQRFLPPLQAMAQWLRGQFQNIRVNVWSSAIGSATTNNPAHSLGIDCVFDFAPKHEADNVAPFIEVIQVNDDPYLSDLSVCWGAGARERCIGTDLLEYPVPWSSHAATRIEEALPILFETLVAALRTPPF